MNKPDRQELYAVFHGVFQCLCIILINLYCRPETASLRPVDCKEENSEVSFSGKSLQKIQMLDRANGDCIRKLEKAILSESDILYFNIDFVARFASHQKIQPGDLETRTLNLDFTPYRIYCRKLVNARLLDRRSTRAFCGDCHGS